MTVLGLKETLNLTAFALPQGERHVRGGVITSYSIHYTKLYDDYYACVLTHIVHLVRKKYNTFGGY